MNTDIRISVHFYDNPKTVKLERRLGLPGIRSLQQLWMWSAIERPDGNLDGLDDESIEIAARWNGEPTTLVNTLTSLGWLDGSEGNYRIHDWVANNPWVAETVDRSNAARLSRLYRSNPRKAEEISAQGRTGITAEEYREYSKSTVVVRSYNARSTPRTTPAPAPTPTPKPITYKETTVTVVGEGGMGGTTSARESEHAAQYAVQHIEPATLAEPEHTACSEHCSPPNGGSPPPTAPPVVKKVAQRATRLSEDWVLPGEWMQWAVSYCADKGKRLDVQEEAAKFADHFRAKAGQSGCKNDWLATWRNWIRNSRGQSNETNWNNYQRPLSAAERVAQDEQRFEEYLARQRSEQATPVSGSRVDASGDSAPVETHDGNLRTQMAERLWSIL